MKILVLSSSLFTNRLLSKSFFNEISARNEVDVWAVNKPIYCPENVPYFPFPETKNNRELVNIIRHINDKAWAIRLNAVSILSMSNFNKKKDELSLIKLVQNILSKVIAVLFLEKITERLVHYLVRRQKRSNEAYDRLRSNKPDVIIVTNPFWLTESSIAIEAQKLGIKIISVIPSWDNITTKSRMTFNSEAYFVWSDLRKLELYKYYPESIQKHVAAIGTPQYEVYFDDDFFLTKDMFCQHYGLNPQKKTILYATGSPNFIKTEYEGAYTFAQLFKENKKFKDSQLVIRPHPNKDNNELLELNDPENNIFVQFTPQYGLETELREQNKEDVKLWVNTFRYADVIINLSSTVIFDAIAFDKPVININYDPNPLKEYENFIKEINSTWIHLKEIWESKDIPQVNNYKELIDNVLFYLENNKNGMNERKKLYELVCRKLSKNIGIEFAQKVMSLENIILN